MSQDLIKRRKTLARTLLYGLPILLVTAALLAIRHFEDLGFKDWSLQDWKALEEVQILQRYIQIDTSYPHGNEVPGAEYLAGILEANGIPAQVIRIGERYANVVATLEGDDPRPLVLHNHIDVLEPILPEQARFPPFAGHIDLPFLFGRGAFDMKSYAVAQLMSMLEIKRSGQRPKRSLMFLATGDEETGGFHGVRFLLREHPEWREQFWGVLTEGGAIEAFDVDRARYWGTEFAQKMLVEIKVCDPREERLLDLAAELKEVPQVRRLSFAELPEFLEIFGSYRDRPETRKLLEHPESLLNSLKSFPRDVDVTVLPPYLAAMLSDEMVLSPVLPSPSKDGWELFVSIWVLPERTLEEAWGEQIGDRLRGFHFEVFNGHQKAVPSPLHHPLFTGLDSFMKDKFPEIPHGPLFIPWAASESRYFREAGIPSYGFTPFWILSGDGNSMKGVNERIPLPAYVDGVRLYEELVWRLVFEKDRGFFE